MKKGDIYFIYFHLIVHISSEEKNVLYEVYPTLHKEAAVANLTATDIITISNEIGKTTEFATLYNEVENKQENETSINENQSTTTSQIENINLNAELVTIKQSLQTKTTEDEQIRNVIGEISTKLKIDDYNTLTTNQAEQTLPTLRKTKSKTKYIYQWTFRHSAPFENMDISNSRQEFVDRNCSYTNCVFLDSWHRDIDYIKYDAIVFFAKDLVFYDWKKSVFTEKLPTRRSLRQKYVFVSLEPVRNLARVHERYIDFFNWTWTYKLDSDLKLTFYDVKDVNGTIVAPSKSVQWLKAEYMQEVPENIKDTLRSKTRAVAYFDPCTTYKSTGQINAITFLRFLKSKHPNVTIDKFGKCQKGFACGINDENNECDEIIRKDYYFYLVFEETMSEDYVTDNVLRAVNNNAIPIVFGGANYSRFLPEGSYINAKDYSVGSLTTMLVSLLEDPDKYANFFKWTNHYTFHRAGDTPETDHLCKICELMNDEEKLAERYVYEDIAEWWTSVESYKRQYYDSLGLPNIYFSDPPIKPTNVFEKIVNYSVNTISKLLNSFVTDAKSLWNKLTS